MDKPECPDLLLGFDLIVIYLSSLCIWYFLTCTNREKVVTLSSRWWQRRRREQRSEAGGERGGGVVRAGGSSAMTLRCCFRVTDPYLYTPFKRAQG